MSTSDHVSLAESSVTYVSQSFVVSSFFSQVLLQKPLAERRAILREHFVPVEGEFQFATSTDAESVEEISTFLETSVKDGCEGLMVKSLETADSTYEPSKRSQNWLKVGNLRDRPLILYRSGLGYLSLSFSLRRPTHE